MTNDFAVELAGTRAATRRPMLRASVLISLLGSLAACTPTPISNDVVGPFTGATHRFVIDRFDLPRDNEHARALGDDLDGDGVVDNALGVVLGTLSTQGDTTSHGDDMIAAGSLTSVVEIQADDLAGDASVGVWYFGAAGAPATPVGGSMENGVIVSNRTRSTEVWGAAVLRLPVFANADPSAVELIGMQMELTPDGIGGYDGFVQGAVRQPVAMKASYDGVIQMLAAKPQSHTGLWSVLDLDRDGIVTVAEFGSDRGLMSSLLATDLRLPFGAPDEDLLSLGFGIHLVPCESGRCAPQSPIDRCFDRVIDSDESDTDCGGSCGDCPAGGLCRTGADCQSGGCEGGICRPSTCSDGLLNQFEDGVDCGGSCAECGI